MRECDFCGTPATDPNATACELCGSALPATAAPAAEEQEAGQPSAFDASATVATPMRLDRLAAPDGPPSLPAEVEAQLPAEPALPASEPELSVEPTAAHDEPASELGALAGANTAGEVALPSLDDDTAEPPADDEPEAAPSEDLPEEAISTLRAALRGPRPAPSDSAAGAAVGADDSPVAPPLDSGTDGGDWIVEPEPEPEPEPAAAPTPPPPPVAAPAVDFLGRIACRQCGQRNSPNARTCVLCGASLDAQTADAPSLDSAPPGAASGPVSSEAVGAPSAAAGLSATSAQPGQQGFASGSTAAPDFADGADAAAGATMGSSRASFGSQPDMEPAAGPQPQNQDDFESAATVVSGPAFETGGPAGSYGSEKTVVFGEPVEGVACSVCGADNDTVSAFCVRCGARLDKAESGPEAAASTFAASGPSTRNPGAMDMADAPTVVPEPREPGGPQARTGMSTPQVRCPSCRSLNDAAGAFCLSCGASLRPAAGPESGVLSAGTVPPPVATPPPPPPRISPSPAPRPCPSCGVANDAGTRFCISCGTSMTRDPLAAQRPADPPPFLDAPTIAPPPAPPARDPFAGRSAPQPAAPASRDPFARAGSPPPPPPPPPVQRAAPPPLATPPPPPLATPAPSRDPFARSGPATPPPAASRDPFAASGVASASRDPFARSEPAVPPPAYTQQQPSFTPVGSGGTADGSRMSVLVIVGVIAGAAIGAAIALGLMTVFDVSPF